MKTATTTTKKSTTKITPNEFGNMFLPDGKFYSLDDWKTRRNNNVIVIGSPGSSKTRSVITPNLLECVGSYVITDPKGNLYKQWGGYMEQNGYRVVRLSFCNPAESAHYNPMSYLKSTQQIMQMSSALSDSTRSERDPYWDESAKFLLNSVIAYVLETQYGEKRNFHTVIDLMRQCGRKNEHGNHDTGYSQAVEELNRIKPHCWAYKQFENANQAPNRTFDCTVAVAVSKLNGVDTEEIAKMMRDDDIDLPSIGQRKTAVFVEVSDTDRSMDLLVNLFFTQAMNQLCTYADTKCKGSRLPVPVRFLMDDFATNCKIDKFENMMSNIRSRKISAVIVLQSIAQLKAGYADNASTIVDDCDTLVYMGGNDPDTAKQIGIRCDRTAQNMLSMPLNTTWICRRGEKPFMCETKDLDDYLRDCNPKALKYKKERDAAEDEEERG